MCGRRLVGGMPGEDADTGKTIQSVETALAVLDAVGEREPVGVTEVADALDRSKASVHHHLNTLRQSGYLEQVDGKYRLGLAFLSLGGQVRERQSIYHLAKADADDLAAETGELVRLVVERADRGVVVYQTAGEHVDDPDTRLGSDEPLYCTAAGKAFLAELPADRIDRYLAETDLRAHTDRTITDPDRLREELATIDAEGVAFDDGERYEGVRCVACAVHSPDGELLGAISVSGSADRLTDERFRSEIPDRLQNVVGVVELQHTYSRWTEMLSEE